MEGSKVPVESNNGFIMIKSLVWDGAYTMYHVNFILKKLFLNFFFFI